MKLLRRAVVLSITGSALAIVGGSATVTAQDPRKPSLPEYTDAPPANGRRDGEADRVRLREARREIELLEARVAVRKAEIEEIMARVRLSRARERLSAVVAGAYRDQPTLDDLTREAVPFPDSSEGPQIPLEEGRQIKKAIIDAVDAKNRPVLDALGKRVIMAFPDKTPLEDVLRYVRSATKDEKLPNGVPISVDAGIPNADEAMRKSVTLQADDLPLMTSLTLVLRQVDLTWTVKDGLLVISAAEKKESRRP